MTINQTVKKVRITEVGPRDGLQNLSSVIPTDKKLKFIKLLLDSGIKEIEVASFVSPKWVPQMFDALQIMQVLSAERLASDIQLKALIPNMKGWDSLVSVKDMKPAEILVFGAASESFSQKNINCSIEESIRRFACVVEAAHAVDVKVCGSISCALNCPFEGDITPEKVGLVAGFMKQIGVDCISVADTTGAGTPQRVQAALQAALDFYSVDQIKAHFHDTYGMAVANILASLEMGIAHFDSSAAGLGGCPYAPGARGNVATEDVVYLLDGLGIETGIDLDKLVLAGQFMMELLGQPNASRTAQAVISKKGAGSICSI